MLMMCVFVFRCIYVQMHHIYAYLGTYIHMCMYICMHMYVFIQSSHNYIYFT